MPEEIAVEEKRNISTEERNRAPDSDFAGPHRSFPILKPADVAAAFHSLGRAKGDSAPIRARIISIAKRKGFPLPKSVSDANKQYHELNPLAEGEKCGMCDAPSYVEPMAPFGGATSFAEMDEWSVNQALAEYVDEVSYRFKMLMDNIMNDDMMSPAEKASAASALAKEMQERIATPDGEELDEEKWEVLEGDEDDEKSLSFWGKFRKKFRKKNVKALETENTVTLPANRGFKVYRDLEGDLRWLSLSSNAFEDLDKELFTTKALEEAIEHADKTGERGPLLIYHVPSAEIGQCDYQAMAGRFLVESGTFDDTPLGRKAVEYFTNSDEEHQVSIGYQYHLGDEEDGVYDWTRIIERSVTPYGAAANPWTDFKVIGDNPMDAKKAAVLEKIFGKELATGVITNAETKTKELEATTKFKEKETEPEVVTLDELNAAAEAAVEAILDSGKAMPSQAEIDKMPDGPAKNAMQKRMDAMNKKEVSIEETAPPAAEAAPTFGPEQLTQLATLITDLSNQVSELTGLSETVKELQTQVKELSVSDEQKMLNVITPRWPGVIRPTESKDNLVTDQKAIDELTNKEAQKDPAAAYVEDLLGGSRVASN